MAEMFQNIGSLGTVLLSIVNDAALHILRRSESSHLTTHVLPVSYRLGSAAWVNLNRLKVKQSDKIRAESCQGL